MRVRWVPVPEARRQQYTPVGLRLVDDFTGKPLFAAVAVTLEALSGSDWRKVEYPATLTPAGRVAFLGLGRTVNPLDKPVVRHRARVSAPALAPLYGTSSPNIDHVEFDVHPHDDTHAPAAATAHHDVFLLPAPDYAYPGEILVARGKVVDGGGAPVARALVSQAHLERVLTDVRGEFALPLRWAAKNSTLQIDVADGTGRTGSASLVIPGGLRPALQIAIA